MSLREGEVAPDFTLPTDGHGEVSLSDYRGRKVILYFYPKDDTPGCTVQACDFRDTLHDFEDLGAQVLGVSADGVESHAAFRKKLGLNFPLLADVGGRVSERYGVWGERTVHGRPIMGIERSTFLIDEEGRIERVWRGVRAQGHAAMLAELLAADD